MQTKNFWQLLKETYHQWSEDKAARLAAAMSYYTLFSLAPLLVLAIAIAGYFFTQQTAENQIMSQVTNLAGPTAAEAMRGMIRNTHQGGANVVASILGLVLLLVGASGVFGSLQDALNTIWQVKMDPRIGVRAVILNRLFSFAMVLAIGFLLLVSLVVSAALTALGTFFQNQLPAGTTSTLFQVFNIVISLVVITLLFAMIYRVVPDAEIDWKDVGVGAVFTAVLFTIGKQLIGLYLGRSTATSVYGAAGSLVIILLWVYYSAQILFFGAEFTRVFTLARGKVARPSRHAVWMTGADLANQGISHERAARPVGGGAGRPAVSPLAVSSSAGAVAGAGQGSRDPEPGDVPPASSAGRPVMPGPVRLFAGLTGALAASLGAGAAFLVRKKK